VNEHVSGLVGRTVWGPCLLAFLRQTGAPVNVLPGEVVPEDDHVDDEEARGLGGSGRYASSTGSTSRHPAPR
jgi:hypothetical protein